MPRSNFQIILLIVFGVFAALAVLMFSGVFPIFNQGDEVSGDVLIWGTKHPSALAAILEELAREHRNIRVTYRELGEADFDREFIEALAAGRGPDLFFLQEERIVEYEDKAVAIPYENFPAREFRDTYIEESELFLTPSGVLGFPIIVDPMVMYWNRDFFASAGLPAPPAFWDEFITLVPKLTIKDAAGNITRSAVSLGEMRNVAYGKDIIAMLLLQLGNPIVRRTEDGTFTETLLEGTGGASRAAESVLRFYTEFGDAAKSTYTWNRSFPNSKQAFIAERSAIYFGYASEILDIRSKNPHLNFDVARVPQLRGAGRNLTFGRMETLAITRASKNPGAAYYVAGVLSSAKYSGQLAEKLYLPPPRRDLLGQKPKDPYLAIFYDNALTSRAWLDPDPEATAGIWTEAVENVVSGRLRISEAVNVARDEIERLLSR